MDVPGAVAATGGPIAYVVGGREFIANPLGGNPMDGTAVGDALAAFALPASR